MEVLDEIVGAKKNQYAKKLKIDCSMIKFAMTH